MKAIRIFFILVLSSTAVTSMQSMDKMHIPRKKGRKRLVSSKEQYEQRFLFGSDEEDSMLNMEQVPISVNTIKAKRRSQSITLTKVGRRGSTGQIGINRHVPETQTNYSPRLERQDSKGSIVITPRNWVILNQWKKKQDDAKKEIEEARKKLEKKEYEDKRQKKLKKD